MFALNFLLESAMHEGIIWLKISKTNLQNYLSFTPAFHLQIPIPITQHLNYHLDLIFNS
jgi:hypothetical protein